MTGRLSSSYWLRGYQLLANLNPPKLSKEEAFNQTCDLIYDWSRRKFANIFGYMPYKKETFEYQYNGNEIGLIYNKAEGQFIFRCAHPDADIAGRFWITDIHLNKKESGTTLAVRLSVSSLYSCPKYAVPFSRPGFITQIINKIGLSDIYQLSDTANYLSQNDDVDHFISFLEAHNRKMPVVLLTPSTYTDNLGQYTMDPKKLASDLSGIAHVFTISPDANEYFTDKVSKQWSAFNGSVRTYYPHLTFQESDYYRHPMLTQKSIRHRNMENSDTNLCMNEVEQSIKKYVLRQLIKWEENDVHFYLSAYQALSDKTKQTRNDLIHSLEIAQKASEENLSLAESYASDYSLCRKENDELRQINGQLKSLILSLRYQLKEATGADIEQKVPESGGYSDIPDWISTYYSDKLYLTGRAQRSLKNAQYEDIQLVYKCLKLLANQYYDYCMGEISYDDFLKACKTIDPGLNEAAAATDVAAGMQDDEYFVFYRGKNCKLDRHLTKGSSRDPRYCLRIYFFWADDEQIVVIGDLPHHLNTSAT